MIKEIFFKFGIRLPLYGEHLCTDVLSHLEELSQMNLFAYMLTVLQTPFGHLTSLGQNLISFSWSRYYSKATSLKLLKVPTIAANKLSDVLVDKTHYVRALFFFFLIKITVARRLYPDSHLNMLINDLMWLAICMALDKEITHLLGYRFCS